MPVAKATTVLTAPRCLSPATIITDLHAGLSRHLVNLTGDPQIDIDRVDTLPQTGDAYYLGTYQGRRRILAALMLSGSSGSASASGARAPGTASVTQASVLLIATHGSLEAAPDLMWSDPTSPPAPGRGNPLHVARLLHVTIFYLHAAGFAVLHNDPVNARVRRHYEAMGFSNGENLDLGTHGQLTRAFRFVAQVYVAHNLSLTLPPLPL